MGEKVMQCQAKARSGAPVFISVAHLSDCCRGLGDGLAATAANQAIIGLSGRAIIGKSPGSVKQKRAALNFAVVNNHAHSGWLGFH